MMCVVCILKVVIFSKDNCQYVKDIDKVQTQLRQIGILATASKIAVAIKTAVFPDTAQMRLLFGTYSVYKRFIDSFSNIL